MSTCEIFLLCCDGLTRPIEPNPADVRAVPLGVPDPTQRMFPPGPADVRSDPLDPADVQCRAVGLDLQSRPIEYKDFQSAKAMN